MKYTLINNKKIFSYGILIGNIIREKYYTKTPYNTWRLDYEWNSLINEIYKHTLGVFGGELLEKEIDIIIKKPIKSNIIKQTKEDFQIQKDLYYGFISGLIYPEPTNKIYEIVEEAYNNTDGTTKAYINYLLEKEAV